MVSSTEFLKPPRTHLTSHGSIFFNRRSAAPRLRELSISNGAGPMLSCSPTTERLFFILNPALRARQLAHILQPWPVDRHLYSGAQKRSICAAFHSTRDYSRRLQSNQLTLNLPLIMCSCFQRLLAYFMNDARMNSIGLLGAANEKNMKKQRAVFVELSFRTNPSQFSGLVKRGLPLVVF